MAIHSASVVHLFSNLRLFLVLILAMATPANAQNQNLAAIVNGNRHVLPISRFDDQANYEYISLENLAQVLNLHTYYSNNSRRAILYIGNKEIKLNALNPYVQIEDRILQMPIETRYDRGEIFVPVHPFLTLISPYLYDEVQLVAAETKSTPEPAPPVRVVNETPDPPRPAYTTIRDLQIEEKANGLLIRIRTDRPVESSHVNSRITNGWLYVDLYRCQVASPEVNAPPNRVFKEIRPLQVGESAQLSFKLIGEITARKIYTDPQNNEVLVSLTTNERVPVDLLKSIESEKQKWLIDTIVIDAGHGGHDPGAVGPGPIYEKDVTLAIALQLKKLLEDNSDIRVVMTREEDRFVPLSKRTRMANQSQGKLFISIHANSNRNPHVKGLTTYFLGPAKTEEALEVARRENAVINYEQDKSLYAGFETEGFILLKLAQNAYQQESEELAALVQEEVSKRARIRNRGVKQAGYYVLIGASMPNILIETAFISNSQEARLLVSKKFQKQIAEGIFASIMRFKRKYEQGI